MPLIRLRRTLRATLTCRGALVAAASLAGLAGCPGPERQGVAASQVPAAGACADLARKLERATELADAGKLDRAVRVLALLDDERAAALPADAAADRVCVATLASVRTARLAGLAALGRDGEMDALARRYEESGSSVAHPPPSESGATSPVELAERGLAELAAGRAPEGRRLLDRTLAGYELATGVRAEALFVVPSTAKPEGNQAYGFPSPGAGYVLLGPGGPERWLGASLPFASAASLARVDAEGVLWLVRRGEASDVRLGTYRQAALAADGSRLFACNDDEAVVLSLPGQDVVGRRTRGCAGDRARFAASGRVVFERAGDDDGPFGLPDDLLASTAELRPLYDGPIATGWNYEGHGVDESGARIWVHTASPVGQPAHHELRIIDTREARVLASSEAGWQAAVGFATDGEHAAAVTAGRLFLYDLAAGTVSDLGASPAAHSGVAFDAHVPIVPYFTRDGRVCVLRGSAWVLVDPQARARPAHDVCFPGPGGARVVPAPLTAGHVLAMDPAAPGGAFPAALDPSGALVACVERPAGSPAGPHFVVIGDARSGAQLARHRLPRLGAPGEAPNRLLFGSDLDVMYGTGLSTFPLPTLPADDAHDDAPEEAAREVPEADWGWPVSDVYPEIWGIDAVAGSRVFVPSTKALPARLYDLASGLVGSWQIEAGCGEGAIDGEVVATGTCERTGYPWHNAIRLLLPGGGEIARDLDDYAHHVALRGDVLVVDDGRKTLVLRRSGDALELERTIDAGDEPLALSEGGTLLALAGREKLRVLSLSDGRELFSREPSCRKLRMLPGDVVQCDDALLSLAGEATSYRGAAPVLLSIDDDRHHARVARAEGVATIPWDPGGATYAAEWSESADGRSVLVRHGYGVSLHALATGERLVDWIAGEAGAVAFVAGGVVELWGEPPEQLACSFAGVLAPFEVCRERLEVPGAAARLYSGDRGYLAP